MKPAIVALYSWSGHTRAVGTDIAKRLGCPVLDITETRPRRGLLAYLRAGYEALTGKMPDIAPVGRNLRDFPLLVIGTPVWVGRVSSPVRSFLARHRNDIGTVAAFCTMGGRNPANTFTGISGIAGKPLLATLAIPERDIGSAPLTAKLDAFIDEVRARG
jgi:flavodoxin